MTPDPDVDDDARENLETLATEITERVEIRLEHEAHYDWVAFVPQRESDAGALTKYFGKVAGDDDFKIRGIEARQRSTPPFIEDIQRDCLERLDATRSPDAVLGRLERAIDELQAGNVAVERLVERNRVSKPLEGYSQNTQNVAALKRAREQELAVHPARISNMWSSTTRNPRETVSPSPTKRSRPTTPRTTKRSWSERSRACSHRSGGTEPIFVERSPMRGTPF
ncbi:DNA polymerase elongation subunit (family B) [Halarchaeum solikamskense]|nr:DNA polymerase elongation subunit (family B) [Halarchaeum solikamskense]